jgi:hypothetical protein
MPRKICDVIVVESCYECYYNVLQTTVLKYYQWNGKRKRIVTIISLAKGGWLWVDFLGKFICLIYFLWAKISFHPSQLQLSFKHQSICFVIAKESIFLRTTRKQFSANHSVVRSISIKSDISERKIHRLRFLQWNFN